MASAHPAWHTDAGSAAAARRRCGCRVPSRGAWPSCRRPPARPARRSRPLLDAEELGVVRLAAVVRDSLGRSVLLLDVRREPFAETGRRLCTGDDGDELTAAGEHP